jgi:hypothetical protein
MSNNEKLLIYVEENAFIHILTLNANSIDIQLIQVHVLYANSASVYCIL